MSIRHQIKWAFLASVLVFELGSLICGVAPNTNTLIAGRAVAGIGVGGIFSGTLVILSLTGTSRWEDDTFRNECRFAEIIFSYSAIDKETHDLRFVWLGLGLGVCCRAIARWCLYG